MQSAKTRFNSWITEITEIDVMAFYTIANTVKYNLDNKLNFFIKRRTKANGKSFNSKIKFFRANQVGGIDTSFFLLRLYKLFA
jgi:hypothetical protein